MSSEIELAVPYWQLQNDWVDSGSRSDCADKSQLIALQNPTMRAQLFAIAEVTSDWIWMTDQDHRFIYLSPKIYQHIRIQPTEVLGRTRRECVNNITTKEFEELLTLVDAKMPFTDLAYGWKGDDGREHFVETSGQPILNEDGGFVGYLGSGRCITERLAQQQKLASVASELKRRADTDALTGLFNREYFNKALADLCSTPERPFVLLLIDLDHFKQVNDSLGHQAGDAALQSLAGHLRHVARSQDIVCRLGGDEFAIIAPTDNPELAGRSLSWRLQGLLKSPVEFEDQHFYLSASIGVDCSTESNSNTSPDGLFRNADIALYRAKAKGRGQAVFFNAEVEKVYRQEKDDVSALKTAISLGQITAHYQPIVKSQTGEIAGAEMLARWEREPGQFVNPEKFIGLAERHDLIGFLGKQLLVRAVVAAKLLPPTMYVAFNVSVQQLGTGDFVETFRNSLAKHKVCANRFHIEVTETVCMRDDDAVLNELSELSEMGACIALDDFGAGHSSLFHLQKFAFCKIKLDRAFLKDINQRRSKAILHSISALANALETAVVAEGVEDESQLAAVQAEGIDEVQGYLFHKPMLFEDLLKLMGHRSSEPYRTPKQVDSCVI